MTHCGQHSAFVGGCAACARQLATARPPSTPRKVWTLAASLAGHVASGGRLVPSPEQERRLAICQECPAFNRAAATCNLCGCHLKFKTRLSSAHCPVNKW